MTTLGDRTFISRELEGGVGPASRITLAPDKQPKPLGDAGPRKLSSTGTELSLLARAQPPFGVRALLTQGKPDVTIFTQEPGSSVSLPFSQPTEPALSCSQLEGQISECGVKK